MWAWGFLPSPRPTWACGPGALYKAPGPHAMWARGCVQSPGPTLHVGPGLCTKPRAHIPMWAWGLVKIAIPARRVGLRLFTKARAHMPIWAWGLVKKPKPTCHSPHPLVSFAPVPPAPLFGKMGIIWICLGVVRGSSEDSIFGDHVLCEPIA